MTEDNKTSTVPTELSTLPATKPKRIIRHHSLPPPPPKPLPDFLKRPMLTVSKISEKLKKAPTNYEYASDMYKMLYMFPGVPNFRQGLVLAEESCHKAIQEIVHSYHSQGRTSPTQDELKLQNDWIKLHFDILDIGADTIFDMYIQYIQWNRDTEKQFYLPRRKQLKPVVDAMQDLADDKLNILAISLPPGAGKLCANNVPILTNKGWKDHGDLTTDDYVVGLDGKWKKVLHVFPKGYADYEVEFTNHDRIQTHGNHEWVIYNRHKNSKIPTIMTTKEMCDGIIESGEPGKRGHRYFYQLPFCQAMQGDHKQLPVDPYVYGVWLGDGTTASPCITICDTDTAILDDVSKHYKVSSSAKQVGCTRYIFVGLKEDLRKLDLCDARDPNPKYIHPIYRLASIEQRLQLLAGLIDTDGTKSRDGRYTYCTINPYLMTGIEWVISTFGWRYSVKETPPKTSSSGVVGKHTVFTISFCPDRFIPCRVERKKQTKLALQRKIAVKSIRKIDPIPGNCIEVEDGVYRVGHTMIPTHNSTLAIFYLTWLAGKYPDMQILTGSHSNSWVRGAYDECLRIMDPRGEYLWHNVFPLVSVTSTNAKDCRIDLNKRKRFETLQFTSIGSGNAGLYRASKLLYCDDLVAGIEEALSAQRLQKLWNQYVTDLRQRKQGKAGACKELHIATRWSVHDIIGRLQDKYDGDPKARFIVIPALNDKDESNFNYRFGLGFDTKFYREQRQIMEPPEWRALYMNEPIERQGLLYPEEELRHYFELPSQEPDAIYAVCDTKDKGDDYCVMPIAYQYGRDFYVEDFICDNGNPDAVIGRIVSKLIRHKVRMARFESNSAGGRVAQSVQEKVKADGGITKITTKFSTTNKETRIIVDAEFAKQFFLFKDPSVYQKDQEYRRAMQMLCGYTNSGRNKHDDVPDAISMLVNYIESIGTMKVEVIRRPF